MVRTVDGGGKFYRTRRTLHIWLHLHICEGEHCIFGYTCTYAKENIAYLATLAHIRIVNSLVNKFQF